MKSAHREAREEIRELAQQVWPGVAITSVYVDARHLFIGRMDERGTARTLLRIDLPNEAHPRALHAFRAALTALLKEESPDGSADP